MTLQLHLPAQPRHELLEGLRAARVGQDGDLVLLSGGHVDDGDLVSLPAPLAVQVPELPDQLLVLGDEVDVGSFLPGGKAQLLEQDPALKSFISFQATKVMISNSRTWRAGRAGGHAGRVFPEVWQAGRWTGGAGSSAATGCPCPCSSG